MGSPRFLTASEYEFRNRFWLIGAVFGLGFFCYSFDGLNSVQWIINMTVGRDSPRAEALARELLGLAALFALGACLLRTWAAAYLRTSVVQDSRVRAESVVADGPYRHVRNPLYLGNLLLAAGVGLLASRTGFFVMVLGMLWFCLRLIGLEEGRLMSEQGGPYLEYRRRVPGLPPSISPRVPSGGLQPAWKQAFLGESFMWAFFLAIASFAITLKPIIMWVIIGAVLAFQALRNLTHRPGQKP